MNDQNNDKQIFKERETILFLIFCFIVKERRVENYPFLTTNL